jgi:hypothetical protein
MCKGFLPVMKRQKKLSAKTPVKSVDVMRLQNSVIAQRAAPQQSRKDKTSRWIERLDCRALACSQ